MHARPLFALLGLSFFGLSLGCYEAPFQSDEGGSTRSFDVPSTSVTFSVSQDDLLAWEALPAEALFEAVASSFAVPADLLEALAWTASNAADLDGAATGLVSGTGWFGLDASHRLEASRIVGLSPEYLDGRVGDIVAAAALLAARRMEEAPLATVLDAAWWPAVAAWSTLPSPYDQAWATDVFALLQQGRIAGTDDQPIWNEADALVVPPHALVGLPSEALPSSRTHAPDYPGAVPRPGVAGRARADRVSRIVLTPTEASHAHSLHGYMTMPSPGAHYLVNRRDGAITELSGRDLAVPLNGEYLEDAVVVAIAAPRSGWEQWTPQSMEATARLVARLAADHGLNIDDATVIGDMGVSFPWAGWRASARCFQRANECTVPSAAPEYVDGSAEREARESTARTGSVPDVPYFYQYANRRFRSSSCQNTSVAMVLEWLGWNGDPDVLTDRFGKDLAQSPAGLARVFNTVASESGISARMTPHTNGTVAGLRALLAQGKPVIVHGYFTSFGHVVVTTGFTGDQYIVNDPAGKWTQTWKGGYPYAYSAAVGKGIRYSRGAFEQAVSTSNGRDFAPLWYHELTNVSGGGTSPLEPEPEADPLDTPSASSEDLDEMVDAPTGGTATSSVGGASDGRPFIRFVTPSDGATVGNPVRMRAVRESGSRTEFWSGPERLADPRRDNPSDAFVRLHFPGERLLTAKNVSSYGTVLATHSILVNPVEVAELTPTGTPLVDGAYRMSADTDVAAAYVEYSVNGYDLTDRSTGSIRATGVGYPLTYAFDSEGPNRLLVGRAYAADGRLLAEGSTILDTRVGEGRPGCASAGTITCGGSVTGDTAVSGADVYNGYEEVVGTYDGPELVYRLQNVRGDVDLGFRDSRPWLYDLDILVFRAASGTCSLGEFVGRVFNSGTLEDASGSYLVVVDGFAGAQGAFTLEADCD